MNLRQNKHRVLALQHHVIWAGKWQRAIDGLLTKLDDAIEPDPAVDALLADMFPPQPIVTVHKVARAKDNVVVLETTDLGEAEEMILKAARQKKAKLVLVEA